MPLRDSEPPTKTEEQKHERRGSALLQEVAEPDHDNAILAQTLVGTQYAWGKPPMFRIPYEVITSIFKLSLPEMDWDERFDLTSNDEVSEPPYTEVYLSQVCSHWRSIALGLPDIWTTFRCQGRHYRKPRLPGLRLKTYLKRSENQLLNLWFDFRNWGHLPEENELHISELLDLILPHAKRWHRLKVISNDTHPIHHSFQSELQTIKNPHLTHFTFCPNACYEDDPRLPMSLQKLNPSIFQRAEYGPLNLTSVCLDSTSFWSYLPPLNTVVTLSILDTYVFDELTPQASVLFSLLKLPSLANLFIGGEVFRLPEADDPIWENADMEWPTLQHLYLSNCDSLLCVLPRIRAPKLQRLILANFEIEDFDTPTSDYQFPALRDLHLVECQLLSPELKSWVSSATRLITSVTISDGDDTDDSMLISLTDDEEFPTFPWPHLEMATLSGEGLDMTDIPDKFGARFYQAQALLSSSGTQTSNNTEPSTPPKLQITCNGKKL